MALGSGVLRFGVVYQTSYEILERIPGMVREIRTSPSEMRNRRLPGSPSLKMYCPTVNFCSRHTSATRASSPSSRSWKMAACFSNFRSTG